MNRINDKQLKRDIGLTNATFTQGRKYISDFSDVYKK